MNALTKRVSRMLMLAASPAMLFVLTMTAQVETTTKTAQGMPQREVTVERGEVVHVSGNDLFVRMADGEIRHFPNVPETARVTVNGQQLGIHDLKPGMKLERTITVTTTPEVVTTVQTVTGKVWQVMPPSTVILTLENGENQQFTVPEGQKFTINGEETDVFGLRKGMVVSATKVTEVPETSVSHQSQVTGSMPAAQELSSGMPILIMRVEVAAPMPPDETPPRPPQPTVLPEAVAPLSLLVIGGLLLMASALISNLRRH